MEERTKLRGYFSVYGGWSAVMRSRFMHGAIALTCLGYGFWSEPGWWDTVIAVMPNLLGFAIAASALIIGVGGERFLELLAGPPAKQSGDSRFLGITANFTFFVTVHAVALLVAVIAKAGHVPAPPWMPGKTVLHWCRYPFWGIGYFCFMYALCLVIAAGHQIYRLARLFDSSLATGAAQPTYRDGRVVVRVRHKGRFFTFVFDGEGQAVGQRDDFAREESSAMARAHAIAVDWVDAHRTEIREITAGNLLKTRSNPSP